jgi:glycosyltransferase involved in cell wall biosynthesis
MNPLVSAVIPTRNRPDLVCQAVRTALDQSYTNLEVIVVVDGPDPVTIEVLEALREPRLRIVALANNVGGSEARNIGVRESRGEWIAFLDDDDTWFPDKISKQIAIAARSTSCHPIITSRVIANRERASQIWPERRPRPNEPPSEYLFCRTRIAGGEGVIQTSTLMAERTLLLERPFAKGLPRHQDWDWLLRVTAEPDVEIEWAWAPLVIYDICGGRNTITGSRPWRESHEWIKQSKHVTPKAYVYFLAAHVAPRLNIFRDFSSLPGLLREMFPREGFSLNALRIFFVFLLIPTSYWRAVLRNGLGALETQEGRDVDRQMKVAV